MSYWLEIVCDGYAVDHPLVEFGGQGEYVGECQRAFGSGTLLRGRLKKEARRAGWKSIQTEYGAKDICPGCWKVKTK